MRPSTRLILETPRLILRVFDIGDVDALEHVHGDPDVMRFSVDGPRTREQISRFIANARDHHERVGYSQWAVVWKPTRLCVGECGLWQQMIDGTAEHEISYRLRRDHWNRGIATEAVAACRVHGFGTLGLSRVVSIIDPGNTASIRVAEKAGMAREKTSVFHGIAVVIYGLSRDG